jgi:hypothetical protein
MGQDIGQRGRQNDLRIDADPQSFNLNFMAASRCVPMPHGVTVAMIATR